MQLITVKIDKPDDTNFILGQTHFIKSVEDIHEALVTAVPGIKFGLAFCEASGKCLVRWSGTDPAMTELAKKNAAAIGAGHSFIVFLGDGFFPLNVLNSLKMVPEVCRIFCATANPTEVVLAEMDQGRGILGVVDGFSPKGVEDEGDIKWRKDFLRQIGYKQYGIPTEIAKQIIDEVTYDWEQHREEEDQQKMELQRFQKDGETKLAILVRNAMDRTQGKPNPEDTAAANELLKRHRIPSERAKQIVDDVKTQWTKDNPAKREPKPGEVITNSVGMKFAWIPPGTFMSSPKEEEGREPSEGADETQHRVTLTKGYYLGVFPVTRGEFSQFVKESGYKTQAEAEGGAYVWTGKEWKLDPKYSWRQPGFNQSDAHPAMCISWNDALAYCKWLSEREKQVYRLPTEAEWEYACRAGTTTAYSSGRSITTQQANFNNELQATSVVGSYPANAWQLYDMHGNALEWCSDWFGKYPKGDAVDPIGPNSGDYRVLRGGSFYGRALSVRSARRYAYQPTYRDNYNGFRVARTLTPQIDDETKEEMRAGPWSEAEFLERVRKAWPEKIAVHIALLEKLKAVHMVSFSGNGKKNATYKIVLPGTKTNIAWVYEDGGFYVRWGTLKDFSNQYRDMWGKLVETQSTDGSPKSDGSFLAGGIFATGKIDLIVGIMNRIKDVIRTSP